jgi:malate dehydrogenase
MERKDLLGINGKIFIGQGQAIQKQAAPDVRILVVGNPCNTNCLIAMNNAREIPGARWFAMTRLDENRAKSQLARKSGRPITDISRMAIWGNHSATQFPDVSHATADGDPVPGILAARFGGTDAAHEWLANEFIPRVAKRGAEIIEVRGSSSVASAASATIDHMRDWILGTGDRGRTSAAIWSNGEYGVAEGLISSFPVIADGGAWQVVEGRGVDAFARERIDASVAELVDAREAVRALGLI